MTVVASFRSRLPLPLDIWSGYENTPEYIFQLNLRQLQSYKTLLCFPHQTAKDNSVEKLLQKLNTWYLEKEGMRIFVYLKKESLVVINSASCPPTTNWLDFLPLNTKEKSWRCSLWQKGTANMDCQALKRNCVKLHGFGRTWKPWPCLHLMLLLSRCLKCFSVIFRGSVQVLVLSGGSCHQSLQSWCVEGSRWCGFAAGVSGHAPGAWGRERRERRGQPVGWGLAGSCAW